MISILRNASRTINGLGAILVASAYGRGPWRISTHSPLARSSLSYRVSLLGFSFLGETLAIPIYSDLERANQVKEQEDTLACAKQGLYTGYPNL